MSKKWSISAFITIFVLVGFVGVTAQASSVVKKDRMFGSVFGDYFWVDDDKNKPNPVANLNEWNRVDDGYGVGLDIGYYITENVALRAEVARQILDSSIKEEAGGVRWGADVLVHLFNSGFYGVGGFKTLNWDNSANVVNAGLGYRMFLNNNLSLFTEGNYYHDILDDHGDIGVKLGLSWLFDAKAAPVVAPVVAPEPAPVVVDTDGDGVPDDIDKCPNTPLSDKVDADGCSILVEKEVSFDLKVLFANNSADIGEAYKVDIKNLATFMERFPNTDVEIQGHASVTGKADYNLKLSELRAQAVADVLINEYNIASSRVTAIGYGFTQPIVSGNTPEAHAANRRIKANVTAIEQTTLPRK